MTLNADGNIVFSGYSNGRAYLCIIQDTTGMTSVSESENNAFSIFPNPTTDYITIETDNENNNIEIYDLMGIKQLEMPYSKRIDVSALSSGVYFVKCGSKVIKFVKL